MKKYILSLFVFLTLLMPVLGLSAEGLTASGTVDGEKQSPLYRLFYKEHRITSNDSVAFEDSDGTKHSFNDIFEDFDIVVNSDGTNPVTFDDSGSRFYFVNQNDGENDWEKDANEADREKLTGGDDYYISYTVTAENDANVDQLYRESAETSESTISLTNIFDKDTYTDTFNLDINDSEGWILIKEDNSGEITMDEFFIINLSDFEEPPSQTEMDTYRDVYLTVEEGETYYYYTFDGGFISILWVAVLFSGSYLYIRKAEVEDTKQAMIQASIFFIIGLVLLRVIQTII